MNEWGIPDWCEADAYLGSSDWDFNRWRWEFLRRRNDYRRAFDTLAPYSYADEQAAWQESLLATNTESDPDLEEQQSGPPPPIESREFRAAPVWGQVGLFDYFALPNPRFSHVPAEHIIPIHSESQHSNRVIDAADCQGLWDRKFPPYMLLPHGYIGIRFSLTSPITMQLDGLQKFLEEQAAEGGFNPIRRIHPDKWASYLRVIDARAAGASWAEIVICLPEHIGNRTPQASRDVHKQALALQWSLWPSGSP